MTYYAISEALGREAMSELPDYLQDDAPYVQCNTCRRKSWALEEEGRRCNFPQPDGRRCQGEMIGRLPEWRP